MYLLLRTSVSNHYDISSCATSIRDHKINLFLELAVVIFELHEGDLSGINAMPLWREERLNTGNDASTVVGRLSVTLIPDSPATVVWNPRM